VQITDVVLQVAGDLMQSELRMATAKDFGLHVHDVDNLMCFEHVTSRLRSNVSGV
jgi:hypothetical protein